MYYGMFWDPTYILVIIGAAICAVASINVSTTFKRYSKTFNHRGITAEQCAREILQSAGILDVRIERVNGNLTDHYSPKDKVLRLSESVYGSSSIAAIGVAAHECGHAIQHQVEYSQLKLRTLSVPMANFGSFLSWPLIIIGLIMSFKPLILIGIILFTFVVLFQLITLPVEFNASRRAVKILSDSMILTKDEVKVARKVLSAAAMTYVAALFASVLQLLRLLLLARGRRD
ncbi:MAG: zinc metallopeptidase [Clostridia bacterium]|nr:zinc metallopeptidase [Clostridia bacterium]